MGQRATVNDVEIRGAPQWYQRDAQHCAAQTKRLRARLYSHGIAALRIKRAAHTRYHFAALATLRLKHARRHAKPRQHTTTTRRLPPSAARRRLYRAATHGSASKADTASAFAIARSWYAKQQAQRLLLPQRTAAAQRGYREVTPATNALPAVALLPANAVSRSHLLQTRQLRICSPPPWQTARTLASLLQRHSATARSLLP
ncbi:hypothetical protein NPIL_329361 [Nephila pilipes]|uniref:Uncharacterized protein n=1 Tax=Nephila pilipes TaxID=299642 RepID=A0A8X6QGU3_NEPPI|nr:hypothetical protein NPIL_329361 [Nephila pilipes]